MENNRSKFDDIKSIYILKAIILHLSKKPFLNLIRFNKSEQSKLDINIEDYKKFGNRFKIGEKNGLGKEYILNSDILIFEGEYLNGEKNGKGKEYHQNGQVKFEGEYLNGKILEGKGYDSDGNEILVIEKNGKGKEIYKNGRTQFEGVYYNGKKWQGKGYNYEGKEKYEIKYGKGIIIEYTFNGEIKYEGDYKDGKRNGKGKEYLTYNDIPNLKTNNILKLGNFKVYEGEYLNGEKNGLGKEYFLKNRKKFEGEYLNGKQWNGKGYDIKGEVIYEIKDGKGHIKEYYYNGELIFEGDYLNGEKNGRGTEYYLVGKVWTFGIFALHNLQNSRVIKFIGEYLNGKRNGKGKEYSKNGDLLFEGEYSKGKRNGKGKEFYPDKNINNSPSNNYIATAFINDLYHHGVLTEQGEKLYMERKDNNKKLKFEGEYLDGERNGKGKEFSDNGNDVIEIEYLNGKIIGEIKEFKNGELVYIGECSDEEKNKYNNNIYLSGFITLKRNGKGKEYKYGQLLFEGEYLNGKKNGKGKEYYLNKENIKI